MVGEEMLSQDEIDALLRGVDADTAENEDFPANEDYLTHMEKDALGEIGNISFGSSATALSTLLSQKVDITTPAVSVILQSKLSEEFPHPYVAIQVNYTEGFSGSNLLVINKTDATIIADLMLGGDGLNPSESMGEIQLSAVQEAMNQMMGSAATSMSTIFSKRVDISPPSIDILDVPQGEGTEKIPNDELLVKISFRLKIGSLIDSSIMQLLPYEFAKSLVNELLNPGQGSSNDISSIEEMNTQMNSSSIDSHLSIEKEPEFIQKGQADEFIEPENYKNEAALRKGTIRQSSQIDQPLSQNFGYQNAPQHIGASFQSSEQPNVQPAAFSNFEPYQLHEPQKKNLNMLLDIPLQVTVELGRTKRSVKDILELSAGSIIELDKLAGEPVDILVNNRLIAQGEVVVIDENFGVRVTDIISQSDRIKKLK